MRNTRSALPILFAASRVSQRGDVCVTAVAPISNADTGRWWYTSGVRAHMFQHRGVEHMSGVTGNTRAHWAKARRHSQHRWTSCARARAAEIHMEDGGRDRKHRCDSTRGSRQHGRGNARLAPFLLKSQEKKGGAKLVQSRGGGGPYTVPDTGGGN